jgi:DNA-binding MarR family transcriptional regulator
MPTGGGIVEGVLIEAWQRLLLANFVMARALDAELQAAHSMTISDYDVLVQLRNAEDHSLTMSELSRRTLLTRSGMTRLVQGLERDGRVARRACATDARVSYAVLTEAGRAQFAAARQTHHAGIRRLFADHFTAEEAEQLSNLLGKIPCVGNQADCDDAAPPCTE